MSGRYTFGSATHGRRAAGASTLDAFPENGRRVAPVAAWEAESDELGEAPRAAFDPEQSARQASSMKARADGAILSDAHFRIADAIGLDWSDLWDCLLDARYPELTGALAPGARASQMRKQAAAVAGFISVSEIESEPSGAKQNAMALDQLERARPHLEAWKKAYEG